MNDVSIQINESKIAKRAYEIHLRRNNSNGDALSDWLMAEAELKKELTQRLNEDSTSAKKHAKHAKNKRAIKLSNTNAMRL